MKTGVIENIDEIRWDIRPVAAARHAGDPGLRRRLDDPRARRARRADPLPGRRPRGAADAGETLPSLAPWDVQENKWRAARYGLDAWIIIDADSNERLLMDDLADLLERLAPVAERLGCADELAAVAEIPRPARRTSGSGGSPSAPGATWSRWSTRSCASLHEP